MTTDPVMKFVNLLTTLGFAVHIPEQVFESYLREEVVIKPPVTEKTLDDWWAAKTGQRLGPLAHLEPGFSLRRVASVEHRLSTAESEAVSRFLELKKITPNYAVAQLVPLPPESVGELSWRSLEFAESGLSSQFSWRGYVVFCEKLFPESRIYRVRHRLEDYLRKGDGRDILTIAQSLKLSLE